MKTLTLVIPAYNCSQTIIPTLNSINIDEHKNDIDVFIVDDGSKDDTISICKKYARKYPNAIYVFSKNNGNWGSVINYVKNKIKTRFIKVLDSDDTLYSENLGTYIQELKSMEGNIDLVFTNFSFFNEINNKTIKNSLTTWFKLAQKNFISSLDNLSYPKFSYITIHSITFSNEVFSKLVDLPENIFYSDSCLCFLLINNCNKICYIPHLYIYKYHISREEQSINYKNMIKNENHILEVFDFLTNIDINKSISWKRASWLASILKMIIKFLFLIISLKEEEQSIKEKEVDFIVDKMHKKIKNKKIIYYLFDTNIKFLTMFSLKTISRIIKIAYHISQSRFMRASKCKKIKYEDIDFINDKNTII